ncbi:MAG: phosphoribosylanthranilate isomerase [Acidobacteriota bacterium]
MSVWIKICGNTSLEDAMLAAEAGADAAGFVFAPSKRRVRIEQVQAITPQLPAHLEKIGVFVDASFEEIAATVEACGLTGIQLHFDAPPELAVRLRARFGAGVRIIGVLHFGGSQSISPRIVADPSLDATLVDSCVPGAAGGTGVAYDWSAAAKTIFQNAGARRYIAAGGLTPENLAEAIRVLKPWGVDVASGVELSPGRKDPARVRAFVAQARQARAE